jgi:prolyl oligopeptidase
MKTFLALAVGLCLFAAACASLPSGLRMTSNDPFLWLEDVEGAKALAWVEGENARSLAILQGDPRYAPAQAQALAILNSKDRLALGTIRDAFLYNFWQDEKNVRGIWRRATLASYRSGNPAWEVLADIDAISTAEKANWVFKGAFCLTGDERHCLLALSNGGKDAVTLREFDVSKRAFTANGFTLPEAKSEVAWKDADTLLVATDWGAGTLTKSGYPFVIKELKRGQPLAQAREILRGTADDVAAAPGVLESEDGTRLPIAVVADTFFTSTVYRLDGATPAKITLPARASVRGLHKAQIVFTVEEDWTVGGKAFPSGALLSMSMNDTALPAPAIHVMTTPGARESIENVAVTSDAVLVAGTRNVIGRMLRLTFDGRAWLESEITLPAGTISLASSAETSNIAFAIDEDPLHPKTLYDIDSRTGAAKAIKSLPAMFDANGLTLQQFEATSTDGVKIPYFVVGRPEKMKTGDAPTLLYGYGGFQVSMNPTYSPVMGKLWLESGGVYVLANIRGGGEFGPAWHQAGLKTKRQIVYDDFIAVAQDLIARKISSPRRLGIQGGSNGGLLMGVMLTQRPDLFHAALVQVPLLDMLRYDKLLAGASWVDEYGSPDVPEERKWLVQFSPYQNLKKRPDFPEPFFVTSTKDDRVHPGHARKYAAKMESLGMPFLYYENTDGGHAASANLTEAAKQNALGITYLKRKLMD